MVFPISPDLKNKINSFIKDLQIASETQFLDFLYKSKLFFTVALKIVV